MLVCRMYILVMVIQHIVTPHPTETLWDKVGLYVSIFQNAAIVEVCSTHSPILNKHMYLIASKIFHSAFGIVKAPLFTTLVQVFSRVALVFITNNVPDVSTLLSRFSSISLPHLLASPLLFTLFNTKLNAGGETLDPQLDAAELVADGGGAVHLLWRQPLGQRPIHHWLVEVCRPSP